MKKPISTSIFTYKWVCALLMGIFLGSVNVSVPTYAQNVVSSGVIAQSSSDSSEQDNQEALNTKAIELLELFTQEDYAQVRESLHPDLQSEWTPEAIETLWQELLKETGAYQKYGKPHVINTLNTAIVSIPVKFQNSTEDILISFNKNQEVIGIDFPNTETTEEIAVKVVDALAAGNFASVRGYLHPFLKEDIFPQQVQQKWEALLTKTGKFNQRIDSEVRDKSKMNGVSVVLITIEFANVTDDLFVIFDDDKRIINIDFPQMDEWES